MSGSLVWRPIGRAGTYPAWLRALKGKSGAYAIRRRGWLGGVEVIYVGESHTGNLYKTITRHFQSWKRGKNWWLGRFAPEQTDPGHTYQRSDRLEVAYRLIQGSTATEAGRYRLHTRCLALQDRWIRELKPIDNRAGVPAPDEEVPF